MYVMNEVIEKKKKDGGKLYIGFQHIEKAYNRLYRELLGRV